jgi:cystathionine gamma-synthase
MNAEQPENLRPESLVVAAGRPRRGPGGPVNEGISLSATFEAGGEIGYARSGTAGTAALEAALGAVEGGIARVFSSGVAATAAVLDGLPAGSTVLIPASFYNFHETILADHQRLGRLTVRRVNTSDLAAVQDALDGVAVLWLEVPSNPMLRVADLPALTAAARKRNVLSVVDATVASPLGLQPLRHGADVSMHSATKVISGHSDVLLGVLSTASPALAAEFQHRRELTGAMAGSLETFLTLRGLRTLAVRRDRAQLNAAELARRLAAHPAVTQVHYPGLPGHPDAKITARILHGAGSLLSFQITGNIAAADEVCGRVRLICHATSLGAVESLIERRGRYPGELAQGTPANLIRLSVGIEHVEDLWTDLSQALEG